MVRDQSINQTSSQLRPLAAVQDPFVFLIRFDIAFDLRTHLLCHDGALRVKIYCSSAPEADCISGTDRHRRYGIPVDYYIESRWARASISNSAP